MNDLAYDRRGHVLALALMISGSFACTAGVKSSLSGTGGTGASTLTGAGGSRGGSTGNGGSVGTGGSFTGMGGDVGLSGAGGNPDAASCQQMELMFKPTTPTVFVLVDRSGSEFDTATTGTFFQLRTAVEQVLSQLDSKVRFGFGAFVGNGPQGTCKVDFSETVVPFALNNSGPIKTEYDMLGMLPNGTKANTPLSDVIPMVKSLLIADKANFDGDRYMMVVTDSESDFCDDGSAICPADAATYMIQDLYTSGIGTLVVGLPVDTSSGTGDAIAPQVLQNFANAGTGQTVTVPPINPGQTLKPSDVYDQCQSAGYNGSATPPTNTWLSVYTAAGHTAADHTSIATYGTTAGTAKVYAPTSTDTSELVDQISAALNSIPRSCTFDLSTFQIDADKLDEAIIYLVDSQTGQMTVPLDKTSTNGWYMTDITAKTGANGQVMHTATQLQLFGDWCNKLRAPTTNDIKFNFPCDLIITVN